MEEGSALKIRIKFAKEGIMKYIGHLDMMRYFQKVMRRAEVDIRYSEGFSPHQIMSFAAPLGVGVTSRGEYVDIEVLSTDASSCMIERLNRVMTEGMEILSYRRLPDSAAAAMSMVEKADYTVRFRKGYEPADWEHFSKGLSAFLNRERIPVLKKTKKGEKETDIRPWIDWLRTEQDHSIRMRVAAGRAANLKPDVVIRAYMESCGEKLDPFALTIHRDEVYGPDLRPLDQFGEDIE